MKIYVAYFIQCIFLIVITPLIMGFIKIVKSSIRGYKGASIFQTYYDLARLFKKGKVISKNSSFITKIGPSLSLAAVITAAFLTPSVYVSLKVYLGNVFMIVFLLVIVKFLNALLGLDCASTFGGMGSSRELFISMFAEPIMFILITFLYFETRTFNLSEITFINSGVDKYSIGHIIAASAFFILILIENARMPVDNPETHLELTMVHEAMILDISGRDLAFVELSSDIKLMIFLTVFINGFLPAGVATTLAVAPVLIAMILYVLKLIIFLVVISLLETIMAKFRLLRVPELTAVALSISMVAVTINYFV
jgi:formate hydrogenlyase subunit 4